VMLQVTVSKAIAFFGEVVLWCIVQVAGEDKATRASKRASGK